MSDSANPVSEGNRGVFVAEPYDFAAALEISEQLGIGLTLAAALVRRGLDSPAEVTSLIEGKPEHDPFAFDGMDAAVAMILDAVRAGRRITVHGDYDADGVCATSILVECLRDLDAVVDWYLPDRKEGYGVGQPGVEELQRRGTSLMITVDCGIGSRDEIEQLERAGIQSVVTDHHEPPELLPACPVVHPAFGYPFRGLCGAGVAWKLARALASESGRVYEAGLDLVALATVADLVPLVDENRTLVRSGITMIRSGSRVGLRALMDAASVSPEDVDSGALGFRLAPRINAAGRLYRADAGVELMLCEDSGRAAEIGEELNQINSRRRAVERELETGAEKARRDLPADLLEAPALVLAGEGWNSGVAGIVASRLVERYRRPTVVIALEDGRGKGSGRSIEGYDLLEGITAASEHLNRFGGHRMAAGLDIDADQVDAFREAFSAHASAHIRPEQLLRKTRIDGVVAAGSGGIDMDLAEDLASLEPFGEGNKKPSFLVPSARIESVRTMGRDGKHASFDLVNGSGRVKAVGFGMADRVGGLEGKLADVQVEIEINRWRDSVEARTLVRQVCPAADETTDPSSLEPGVDEWTERLAVALSLEEGDTGAEIPSPADGTSARRRELDRRGAAAVPALLDLVSSGESVMVVSCDAVLRRRLADAVGPDRLGLGPAVIVPGESTSDQSQALISDEEKGVAFTDWDLVERCPESLDGFSHVVVVDPPWAPEDLAAVEVGEGFLHLMWHRKDLDAAESALRARWDVRAVASDLWRELESRGGTLSGLELTHLLRGSAGIVRSPDVIGRTLRSLAEVRQIEISREDEGLAITTSSGGSGLDESLTYRACEEELDRRLRNLRQFADAEMETVQAA